MVVPLDISNTIYTTDCDGKELYAVPRLVVDTEKDAAVVYHLLETQLGACVEKRLKKEQQKRDQGKRVLQPLEMPSVNDLMEPLYDVTISWRQQLAPIRSQKLPQKSETCC